MAKVGKWGPDIKVLGTEDPRAAERTTRRKRIAGTRSCVVIGAGLAGLAAGSALSRRGWKVTVLESSSRVGGRVKSAHFESDPGLIFELGGEWIGKQHDAMLRLCRRFRLTPQTHRYGTRFWNAAGRTFNGPLRPGVSPFSARTQDRFKRFLERYDKLSLPEQRELDTIDWWTQLRNLGFSDPELRRRDLMDSTDFGESIRMTSAYGAAGEYASSNPTDEMDFKIPGGNCRLPVALRRDIESRGGRVVLNATVTRIVQTNRGVTAFVGKKRHRADHGICAVPTQALRRINWRPALPEEQRLAAEQLQYARIVKTVVLYDKRFWPKYRSYGFSVFTNGISDFCFDNTYATSRTRGTLCSYAIGDKADDVAGEPNDREVADWITDDIAVATLGRKARDSDGRPLGVVRQAWQMNPGTGGAYALYRPNQWFTVRPLLQRPHLRVHFAGEHLAEDQGFMEGSVDTGETAAAAL